MSGDGLQAGAAFGWPGPVWQFEFLAEQNHGFGLVVQLRGDDEALAMVCWHHPEWAGFPRREVPELCDADRFGELVEEAVRAWAATFPLALDAVRPFGWSVRLGPGGRS